MKILDNLILSLLSLTLIFDTMNFINSLNISPAKNKTKLVVSETYEIQVNQCKELIIPNNYKKLLLNLEAEKLSRVLITDKRIEKCEEYQDISKCCSRNSTFCIENINLIKNDFRLNYCIDYTYIYACNFKPLQDSLNQSEVGLNETSKNTREEVVNLAVTTAIVRGQGCHTTEFIPETACSSIGLVSCKDAQKCSNECNYVECRKESNNPETRVLAMCLPSKLTNEDIMNRCRNHVSFSESSPQIFKITCDKKEEEYIPDKSSHSFFKFLLILMGVLILLIFISSVYYRFKMGMDGIPPFEPPSFSPNFIFPRQSPY
jgi:hypothetical protein